VHANSPLSALYRLEQLVQEAVVTVPRDLIAQAIELLVFLDGRGTNRRVTAILELTGIDDDGDYVLKPLDKPALRPVAS
ncbi:MAG: P-type conjugative transfer ATPase TrbB, partial [Hyphomicrobiaceae bacterium]